MPTSSRLTRFGLALTAAGTLVVPALLASAVPASAGASEGPSTTVPVVAPEGRTMSYVVNVAKVNHGQMQKAERAVAAAGGTVVQRYEEIGVLVVQSTRSSFLPTLRAGAKGTIESAGPTRTVPVSEAPGAGVGRPVPPGHRKLATFEGMYTGSPSAPAAGLDPMEPDQWNNRLIKADKAHEITDGDRKVTVAIVDSGIEPNHPDLQENIVPALSVNCTMGGVPQPTGWEATTSSHGTHVAGTVAAARNGAGIVGVAPAVKLASVKVVNGDGMIYPEYALCGIMWTAKKQIPVANHSYFVDPFQFWCGDQPDQAPVLEAMRRAYAFADRRGVVSAAAAGNSAYDLAHKTTDEESPNDSTPVTRTVNTTCHDIPTELPGVVTVSAIDAESNLASFSNYGEGVIDVAAPGRRILSTYQGQRWANLSGTSMASPHVAGVLALLKGTHPDATPAQLVSLLKTQADDHACPAGDARCTGTADDNAFYGEGVVDALDAVRR
ncbi:S8 family serine peptidase [Mobilicoccus pelagius]|uniref:Peptidase S08 family protein n=1 Tax=Mobilicoccus pelagius NBRC 104925 TaxID=1089455 RepID=H5UPA2_9MICO|nr:S8 family serine peptidase [Mobilicoccus pelagius]GAB47560.1 peptidase S08 family protein [Mobilicoccus pelagius NBRC 104925]